MTDQTNPKTKLTDDDRSSLTGFKNLVNMSQSEAIAYHNLLNKENGIASV